jgi:hypothetical protein
VKNKKHPPNTFGPPVTASNAYVVARLLAGCTECNDCGAMSHFVAVHRKGFSVQTNVAGRVMAVRKAMYMASKPDVLILKGRRITSRCHNPNCINQVLLYQATAGGVLKSHYTKGVRSRTEAAAHLARHTRKNSKVSEEVVLQILNDERGGTEAAHEYGMSSAYFNSIKRGDSRRVGNPFSGLLS